MPFHQFDTVSIIEAIAVVECVSGTKWCWYVNLTSENSRTSLRNYNQYSPYERLTIKVWISNLDSWKSGTDAITLCLQRIVGSKLLYRINNKGIHQKMMQSSHIRQRLRGFLEMRFLLEICLGPFALEHHIIQKESSIGVLGGSLIGTEYHL